MLLSDIANISSFAAQNRNIRFIWRSAHAPGKILTIANGNELKREMSEYYNFTFWDVNRIFTALEFLNQTAEPLNVFHVSYTAEYVFINYLWKLLCS